MADRPILFSAPMVVALLEGRKTQTRRVVKKPAALDAIAVFGPSFLLKPGNIDLARFAIGDRLWVREGHYLTDDGDDEFAVYIADGGEATGEHLHEVASLERLHPTVDWSRHKKQRPSIHMPRWASRLTLLVTDVRVERLQDCNEEDAKAEGIYPINLTSGLCAWKDYGQDGQQDAWASPIESYRTLWDSINGADAWDANPWVVAVSFEVIKQNIDEVQ